MAMRVDGILCGDRTVHVGDSLHLLSLMPEGCIDAVASPPASHCVSCGSDECMPSLGLGVPPQGGPADRCASTAKATDARGSPCVGPTQRRCR